MADLTDEKVYHPTEITENPLPTQNQGTEFSGKEGLGPDVYTPRTVKQNPIPTKKIAHELLSVALNTRTRKILGQFEFTKYGAIQIGEQLAGVSGDVKISPDGIVARNKNGENTFVLDGETGDAFFKGTIQSGALITGVVAVGDNDIVIDGESKRMVFYDDAGIPAIVIGNA